MLSDMLMWNKIGRVIVILSEKLNISNEQALELFYTSRVCDELHNPDTKLYLMGDLYIANDVIAAMK